MKYVKLSVLPIVLFLFCIGITISYGNTIHGNNGRVVIEKFYSQLLSNPSALDIADRVNNVIVKDWVSIPTSSGGGTGSDGFVKTLKNIGQIVPDLKWEPQEILQDGNRYIVRAKATGTPVKPFLGIEPNGKAFEIMSIDIHTVEKGKIVKTYHIEEWHKAIRQLQQK